MTYSVKEIYYTLQGEGAQTGRPAMFCRFTGCNLWSGREIDRQHAVCRFCDTDFVGTDGKGGGTFANAADLADAIRAHGPANSNGKARLYTVLTGGEPMLQVDEPLIDALHRRNIEIGIETNGTLPVPGSIDWICVSPKAGTDLVQKSGNELKFVFPQENLAPEELEALSFEHFFLQPMDNACRDKNTRAAIEYCLSQPKWRLSLQSHKYLGID